MVAAHEVDVETRHDEHVALAPHVLPPHHAVQALELGDAVDFGGFEHGLRAAEDAGHVGEEVLGQLVTHCPSEGEHVWCEQALDAARGGGGEREEGGGRWSGRVKYLSGRCGVEGKVRWRT